MALQDPKVELKLMKAVAEFQGMVLRNALIKERYVEGRDVVVLELLFGSKLNPSDTRTMVLALDKELTINEHTEAVNQLLSEEEKG